MKEIGGFFYFVKQKKRKEPSIKERIQQGKIASEVTFQHPRMCQMAKGQIRLDHSTLDWLSTLLMIRMYWNLQNMVQRRILRIRGIDRITKYVCAE